MTTNWISTAITNYFDGFVSTAVQSAGTFAGDVVGGVGTGINGVGTTIERTIRGYGDGTMDYGNAIKDWTRAPGPRMPTAQNPLGLSDTPGGGKRAMGSWGSGSSSKSSPPARSQPKGALPSTAQRTLPAPPSSSKPASAAKPPAKSVAPKPAAKPAQPKPAASKTTNAAAKRPVDSGKKKISPESRPPLKTGAAAKKTAAKK